jgi:hypothetical protein
MHYIRGCFLVRDSLTDIVQSASAPLPRAVWTSDFTGEGRDFSKDALTELIQYHAFSNLVNAAYPFDAHYHLYVDIPEPRMWQKPMRVERIDIKFVKVWPQG